MERQTEIETDLQILEIQRLIDDFKTKFAKGTSSSESFLTMNELEIMWSELRYKTNELYSNMITSLMNSIDESELIRLKKDSTEKEG